MFKVTGICMNGDKPCPRTVYCSSFSDILYACAGAGLDLNGHFLKIEYIEFTDGQEEE